LRTTHISGSISDVGLICGRLDKANLWKLYIHTGIVFSFLSGAIFAAFTFRELNHKQLFINFSFYTLIGILYTLLVKPEKEYRWIWDLVVSPLWSLFKRKTGSNRHENDNHQTEPAQEQVHSENLLKARSVELVTSSDLPASIMSSEEVYSPLGFGGEENGSAAPLDSNPTEFEVNNGDAFGDEEESLVDIPIDLNDLMPSSHGEVEEIQDIEKPNRASSHGEKCSYTEVQNSEVLSPPPIVPPHPPTSAAVVPPTPSKTVPNPWTYSFTQIGIVLLCLHSGFLNATTSHSSRHLYTTHVTGTGTQFAIDVSNSHVTQIGVNGGMMVCYFLGSVLTGTIVKSDFYSINKSYIRVFIVGTLLLIIALLIHLQFPDSYFFYLILAIFSGMQASLGCKIKGVIIRTTFMSGCATDLGATIGKMLRHGISTGLSSIKMLLPSMLAYITGACFATLLYPVFGNYQVIVNIIAFASIGGLHSYVLHFKMEYEEMKD
jgi:uncharacterized membrane protein YoaK (UPF0700 family)